MEVQRVTAHHDNGVGVRDPHVPVGTAVIGSGPTRPFWVSSFVGCTHATGIITQCQSRQDALAGPLTYVDIFYFSSREAPLYLIPVGDKSC